MSQREAFERWAKGMPLELSDYELRRFPLDETVAAWPNCYQDTETDRLWLAWRESYQATIATLTAERDALVAAVRQTESVTKDKTDKQQASEWMMVDAKEWRAVLALAQQDQPTHFCNKCGHFGNTEQHEGCNYLAAQLKEQDDE